MAHDREVAGIRCVQVLEQLSAYVDGELAATEVARINAHLLGCDWCERFGGEFSSMVSQIRAQLGVSAPVDEGVAERLRERLSRATSTSPESPESPESLELSEPGE